MSACCMPVCGRTVGCELFSIWMMIGALDVPSRAVDPADGTWTTVVKPSVQLATTRSCLRLVAVLGTRSVWVRLWVSVTASGAESARSTSAAATSVRTMGKIHQRRFSVAVNPRLRAMVWRIKGSSAGYSDRPHRLFHAQTGVNCNGYPAY